MCGVLGTQETSVASAIDSMLKAMWRRGSSTRSFTTRAGKGHYVGIGMCDHPSQPSTGFQFHGDLVVAVDGFFYDPLKLVKAALWKGQPRSLSELVTLPGAFSFVAVAGEQLYAGREPVGQKPLYYGEGPNGVLVVASLRSALAAVGMKSPEAVPPGFVLAISKRRFTQFGDEHRLEGSGTSITSEEEAVSRLGELFHEAVSKGVPPDSGIAFSGGLDSTLVAVACKNAGKGPELVTVGVEGQPELEHAHRVATELGLPITICELSSSEIIDSLGEVVGIVESTDPVVVGVSVPFYFACRKARQMGLSTIVAGQMSDELFGGYARFEELALEGELERVESEMWKSVQMAPSNDFEPGDKVAVSLGLELRCPFAYIPLVEYALQLPVSLKVSVSRGRVVRKLVLRRLAEKMMLPDTVVNRPKKAVQYSSGVQRVLRKEARRRNKGLNEFLESFAD
ncbi:MAG TPA: asparagine synthase-related protein [Candidatus Bathyarchaeia archaeon]|nr:asparagine synthase-related protein [Candidatus Bathyarchaeia archaeon]